MPFDNGTSEQVTSDTVAQAFYDTLDKKASWAEFRRVHAMWIEGGTPA